jgi:hypothetical protein
LHSVDTLGVWHLLAGALVDELSFPKMQTFWISFILTASSSTIRHQRASIEDQSAQLNHRRETQRWSWCGSLN